MNKKKNDKQFYRKWVKIIVNLKNNNK